MISYIKSDFVEMLNEKFQKEIEQFSLKIKVLTLNDLDVLIMIVSNNNKRHMNSIVMDTKIKSYPLWNVNTEEYDYFIEVHEESIEDLYTKIKKTIFDICLVK